jgi:hypothetical protein
MRILLRYFNTITYAIKIVSFDEPNAMRYKVLTMSLTVQCAARLL